MKRRQWYRWHKWIGVTSGAALLVWCGTGIVMILPQIAPSVSQLPSPQEVGPQPDYATVTVSPAEATQALIASGATSPVYNAFLIRVGNRVAYDLRMEDGNRGLIDARTGQRFIIDSAAAVDLARLAQGSTGEVIGFVLVDAPNAKYPYGEFPAYTIEFDDDPQISLTTAIATGQVMRSGQISRIRSFIGSLHTFKQLGRFMSSAGAHWTLVVFTVLTATGALMGFWIALPKTWLPVSLGGVRRGDDLGRTEDAEADSPV